MWDIQPLRPTATPTPPSPNKASILGQSLGKAELSLRYSTAKLLSNATVQGSEISFRSHERLFVLLFLRLSDSLRWVVPDMLKSVNWLKVKATFEFSFKSIRPQKMRKPLANISFPQSLHIHFFNFFNLCRQNSLSAVNFSRLGHGIVSSVCLLWNLILWCQRYKKSVFSWRRRRRRSGASWGGTHAFAFPAHFFQISHSRKISG